VKSGVYALFCKATGLPYIGSSLDIHARLYRHFQLLRADGHHSEKLQVAWKKFCEPQFITLILELCSIDVLSERERFYIEAWDSYLSGYNASNITSRASRKIKPVAVVHLYDRESIDIVLKTILDQKLAAKLELEAQKTNPTTN